MGYKIQNDKVKETIKINLIGDTIPHSWFNHIKKEDKRSNSGYKTDSTAILILANILYWYKPRILKDEETDMVVGYEQKFKKDMLQKSYKSYEKKYGVGHKAVKGAFELLEKMDLINREFRSIKDKNGKTLNNVMFVEPVIENIKDITYKYYDNKKMNKKTEEDCQNKETTPPPQKDIRGQGYVPQKGGTPQKEPIQKDDTPPHQKGGTNTETTFTDEFNNKNNKKSDSCKSETIKVQKQIKQLHKAIFGRKVNNYQLGLFADYINQGVSGELIIELFKYECGRNGNQIAFFFNKLEAMIKDGMLSKDDLDNAKNNLVKQSSSKSKKYSNENKKDNNPSKRNTGYKWEDLFADMEKYKENYNKTPKDKDKVSLAELKKEVQDKGLSREDIESIIKKAMSIYFEAPQYNGFLQHLKLVSFESDKIELKAQTKFDYDAVVNYSDQLKSLLNQLFNTEINLELTY